MILLRQQESFCYDRALAMLLAPGIIFNHYKFFFYNNWLYQKFQFRMGRSLENPRYGLKNKEK